MYETPKISFFRITVNLNDIGTWLHVWLLINMKYNEKCNSSLYI